MLHRRTTGGAASWLAIRLRFPRHARMYFSRACRRSRSSRSFAFLRARTADLVCQRPQELRAVLKTLVRSCCPVCEATDLLLHVRARLRWSGQHSVCDKSDRAKAVGTAASPSASQMGTRRNSKELAMKCRSTHDISEASWCCPISNSVESHLSVDEGTAVQCHTLSCPSPVAMASDALGLLRLVLIRRVSRQLQSTVHLTAR